MKKPQNPFLTRGYINKQYFCDRETETAKLISAAQNGRNITLYGRRKLGKSALIKHVFDQLKDTHLCIWVDILPAQNLQGMVDLIATQLYRTYETYKSIGNKFFDGLKRLRPIITYDDLTGLPQVMIGTHDQKMSLQNLSALFHLLSTFNKSIVVALDEFQQITNFPEKETEAYLRTIMQSLPEITFIYSGSDQHMLNQMFTHADRPFYQMSQLLGLDSIPSEKYVQFITNHFSKAKKNITHTEIEYVLEWADGITYYVQFICNRLYALKSKNISLQDIHNTLNMLLGEFEDHFYTYREILTRSQWKLLKSIAKEGKIEKIYSKAFMSKYGFHNSSSLKKSLGTLEKHHLVYKTSIKGQKSYQLQDVFLMRWLQRR